MIGRSASKSISKIVSINKFNSSFLHKNTDNPQKIQSDSTQRSKIDTPSEAKMEDKGFLGFINESLGEWPAWNKFMDSSWMKQTGKDYKVKLIETLTLPAVEYLTRDGYMISYEYMFNLQDGKTYFYPRLNRGHTQFQQIKQLPKYPDGEKVEVYVMPTDLALKHLRPTK